MPFMKKIIISLLLILALLGGFVLYVFSTTGYFREIEASNSFGPVYQSISLPGVEDMALARVDSLLILSVDDRAARREGKEGLHGLYLVDLRDENFTPISISDEIDFPFFPHGISMYQLDSARYGVMAINHVNGKHTVESFLLEGKKLTHLKTIKGTNLISPNDLVMVSSEAFYYSNDHGNTSGFGVFGENYLGVKAANIGYFDGNSFRIVAENIGYANGIQYDFERNLLYVASSRGFLVRVFEVVPTGDLTLVEDIKVGTGVDNIELDESGKLWIGCHPNLMTFAAYAAGKKEIAPSEVITIEYQKGMEAKIESIWTDKGESMSASSVAVPFGNYLFIGNVMDQKMLVLKK
jgi:arylesterase / paraoxonase